MTQQRSSGSKTRLSCSHVHEKNTHPCKQGFEKKGATQTDAENMENSGDKTDRATMRSTTHTPQLCLPVQGRRDDGTSGLQRRNVTSQQRCRHVCLTHSTTTILYRVVSWRGSEPGKKTSGRDDSALSRLFRGKLCVACAPHWICTFVATPGTSGHGVLCIEVRDSSAGRHDDEHLRTRGDDGILPQVPRSGPPDTLTGERQHIHVHHLDEHRSNDVLPESKRTTVFTPPACPASWQ